MTRSARDALIAGACLWVLFAITVGFRITGRVKGIGLGADDILSVTALVGKQYTGSNDSYLIISSFCHQVPLASVQQVRAMFTS